MRRPFRTLAALGAALPLTGCAAHRAETPTVHPLAETHLRPLVDGAAASAIAYALYDGGTTTLGSLSRPDLGSAPVLPLAEHSYFETGSVGKVLTSVLLADAVRRGEVSYDTPVGPEWGIPPDTDDTGEPPILLWHLATHTSGLPRSPDNLDIDALNPYEGYTRDDMRDTLSRATGRPEPGTAYDYSNLGYGLLGAILADRAGADYAALLNERVLGPLFVTDHPRSGAWTHPSDDVIASMAPAHTFGVPTILWGADDALAPSGCVVTNAPSMLTFVTRSMRAHRTEPGPDAPCVIHALRDACTPRFTIPEDGAIALGWHLTDDGTYWHNGGTGGYHSFVAFHPDRDQAIVVLANDTAPEVTRASFRLMDALGGIEREPLDLVRVPEYQPEDWRDVVGRYVEPASGLGFDLSVDDGRLMARLDGQPGFRLFPINEARLIFGIVEAEIEVVRTGDAVGAIVLHQDGASTRFDRR